MVCACVISITWPNVAMSTYFIQGRPCGIVAVAAAAAGCGAGGTMAMALQEALGLCRVEQSINRGKLIG